VVATEEDDEPKQWFLIQQSENNLVDLYKHKMHNRSKMKWNLYTIVFHWDYQQQK
jgi:hypothetical protein